MNRKKITLIIILLIAILSIVFCLMNLYPTSLKLEKAERIKYLAATENATNESDSKNETTNTTNSTRTTQKEEESSNANLKMLGIRPTEYDFTGFKSGTTMYKVTVPSDVEEVEVYGTAQDSKAKVSGLGTKKIDEGLNDLSIVVTAEDGTEKLYTIQLTRESAENIEGSEDNTQTSGEGLTSLKIGDIELSPTFSTSVYEYTAKYIGEENTLIIDAVPTNPNYVVEITGNNNLKEGENLVTILVTDKQGDNVATYQITVNKSLVDEEAIAREQEEARKQEEQKKKIIIGVSAGVIVFIIIIALIIRHKNNKEWADEYTVPFSGLNNDDELIDNNKYGEENWTKEKARKQFLDNYDNTNIYHDQERVSKRKHKGKRFM